jgi:hypothetical protein
MIFKDPDPIGSRTATLPAEHPPMQRDPILTDDYRTDRACYIVNFSRPQLIKLLLCRVSPGAVPEYLEWLAAGWLERSPHILPPTASCAAATCTAAPPTPRLPALVLPCHPPQPLPLPLPGQLHHIPSVRPLPAARGQVPCGRHTDCSPGQLQRGRQRL